jgi:hypothetical protein
LRPLRNNRETKTLQGINGKRTAVVCVRINAAYAKGNLPRQDTIGEFAGKKEPKCLISLSCFPTISRSVRACYIGQSLFIAAIVDGTAPAELMVTSLAKTGLSYSAIAGGPWRP